MRRRTVVQGLGATTILVAGGSVWRAFGQDAREIPDGPAFEPWRTWRTDMREGPLALVHAAILSSNAYNSQPWLFRVAGSRIEMLADTRRNLGAFDPYLREMFISMGCALENLLLAAAANGIGTTVSTTSGALTPPSDQAGPERAAMIDLSPGRRRAPSELFDAIPHRHTNRKLFDAARELPRSFVHDLATLTPAVNSDVRLFLFEREDQRRAIADLVWDATRRFGSDPDVRRGVQPWYRRTMAELETRRDGTFVGAPERTSYVDLMRSGRLFGLIAVRDRYERAQALSAGRLWQRAHLLAAARGVAARPANGAVEVVDHERRLKQAPETLARLATITGEPSWQPTFTFYMGYPTVAPAASVRRPVRVVVLE
ncbi:MAG: hypothetical protein ACM3SQ_04985 [Betaproteobacteria bacterium]